MSEGRVRRVSPATWQGPLRGHLVDVFRLGDAWFAAVMPGMGDYTAVVLRGPTFVEAAAKARAWIEGQGVRVCELIGCATLRVVIFDGQWLDRAS